MYSILTAQCESQTVQGGKKGNIGDRELGVEDGGCGGAGWVGWGGTAQS